MKYAIFWRAIPSHLYVVYQVQEHRRDIKPTQPYTVCELGFIRSFQRFEVEKQQRTRTGFSTTPNPQTISFGDNMFISHLGQNEGFNMHALEGAIHIAISTSFVAVAAIFIDKTNIVLTSPAICIVLTIRWSMSNAIHIAVFNIATVCASMHITPINNIVFNTFNTYCHIRCIAKDKRIELLSLNYCSLGR